MGAGPAGMVCGYYLAKAGKRVVLFERKLSVGGGMWGGGIMFNEIVVQEEARNIFDEFGVKTRKRERVIVLKNSFNSNERSRKDEHAIDSGYYYCGFNSTLFFETYFRRGVQVI